MKIVNERELVREVAEAWFEQYREHPSDYPDGNPHGGWVATYGKLCALDVEKATSQDVKAVIGNDGWTVPFCHECFITGDDLTMVRIGESEDEVKSGTVVCKDCIQKAMNLLSKGREA